MSKDDHSPAQRLKAATATDHLATEKMLGLSRAGNKEFTRSSFRRLVCTNYLIWSAFYVKMQQQGPGWWGEYEPLVKTIVEAAALDFARHSQGKPYEGPAYPVILNPQALAGSLYVHMGSLLGGRFIHSALNNNEGLIACQPFHFYTAGAGFTGAEWRLFIGKLNTALSGKGDLEVALRQAQEIFRHYQTIFTSLGHDD